MSVQGFDLGGVGPECTLSTCVHVVVACIVTPGIFIRRIRTLKSEEARAVFASYLSLVSISATDGALIAAGSWSQQFTKLDSIFRLSLAALIAYDYLVSLGILTYWHFFNLDRLRAKGARPHASE